MSIESSNNNQVIENKNNTDYISENEISTIKEKYDLEKKLTSAKSFYERMDANSDKIKVIQNALIKSGENLENFGADGDFGKETLIALLNFQEKNGLIPDGKAGTNTLKTLGINQNSKEFYSENNKPSSKNKEKKELSIEEKRLDLFKRRIQGIKKMYSNLDIEGFFNGNKVSRIEIQSINELINKVHDLGNRSLRYTSDYKINKKGNFVDSGIGAIKKASGDCEEFAIIKMEMLKEIGIPQKYLKLTYGISIDPRRNKKTPHMVLSVELPNFNKKILLDNNYHNAYVHGTKTQRSLFREIYSMNDKGIYDSKGIHRSNKIHKNYVHVFKNKSIFEA